jgi:subtilase family serine protease
VAPGVRIYPESNTRYVGDVGVRAHTFLVITKPKLGSGNHPGYTGSPPYAGYGIETPASIECVYKFTANLDGCNPNQVTAEKIGGSDIVAIVDAYAYPSGPAGASALQAKSDLAAYSSQFGLPAPNANNFQVVKSGNPPSAAGTGWDIEEALDIEMAHAYAPKAKVILVEAASDSFTDMFTAVGVAAGLVQAAGGGEVSMSWGGDEYSGETSDDSTFTGYTNVVFYASSGDAAGTYYPCVSPDVVCVGGTSHSRNASTLAIQKQFTWSDEGSGVSIYEPAPTYQSGVGASARLVPDVAAIADPNNAVWVYNCTYEGACYWYYVGGTSVASPTTASLDNLRSNFASNSEAYLSTLYGSSGAGFGDITYGYCGVDYPVASVAGFDNCSGWGSPKD